MGQTTGWGVSSVSWRESLSLSGVVPPVRGALQSQWQLEEGHQVMLGRSKEGMFLGKPGGESASSEVVDQLHQATRTLCRNLRKSPVAVEVLYSNHTQQRSPHFLSFLSSLEDLTKVMFRKLSTTVEEEMTNKNLCPLNSLDLSASSGTAGGSVISEGAQSLLPR